MRFVDIYNVLGKARRAVTKSQLVSEADVSDTRKLTELFRDLIGRVVALEAKDVPEPYEKEIDVSTAGATVTLQHSFGCPVRWYVTHWKNATAGPSLVWNSASDSNHLVLASYVAGRAVIRVEPSPYGVN